MQSNSQKQEKLRATRELHSKLIAMVESNPQNKQMLIDTFADNAKFKSPQYQTRQAKVKYFINFFNEILFASLYKSTFVEVDEITNFLLFFFDWVEKHDFPLKMKNDPNSAKKPTEEKASQQKQQQKKTNLNTVNNQNVSTSKQKVTSFQIQKPNISQFYVQKPQMQLPKFNTKPTPIRDPVLIQKGYSPISQPQSNRISSNQIGLQQKQQNQGRGGISPTPNYIQSSQTKGDGRYQSQPKQHFSQNQPSKQQITKKVLAKIYQCYDQPQKRHQLLAAINIQLQNLKKMEGVMKAQKTLRR